MPSWAPSRSRPPSHWDVRIVVAVANEGAKDVGSTEGMTLSEQTSPYYRAWVDSSDKLTAEVREGILTKDLTKVGEAMEQSTLAMHACMMASRPGLDLPAARHPGGARHREAPAQRGRGGLRHHGRRAPREGALPCLRRRAGGRVPWLTHPWSCAR